jgi:molybdopterin synthase catalytic subunit
MISVLLTDKVISLPSFIAQVESPLAGAVATFSGNVRSLDHGKKVVRLSYEIHPSTEEVLKEVAHDVASRHDLIAVAVAHRYGEIATGESALIVAISAAYRVEAFIACSTMVDEIKARIPIWKHQVFADGTDEWVNCV